MGGRAGLSAQGSQNSTLNRGPPSRAGSGTQSEVTLVQRMKWPPVPISWCRQHVEWTERSGVQTSWGLCCVHLLAQAFPHTVSMDSCFTPKCRRVGHPMTAMLDFSS